MAIWLIAGVVMIIVQTLLGGVTRLTESGLSITEWNPILGAIPPINEQEWNKAFEGYKQIGQFKQLNHYFTLSEFKSIFFWEWLHREWGRLLGVVFAGGFAFFLVKKYFDRQMVKPLLLLFVLGGVQGLIGWLMVKTGLNTEDIHVHYIALSIHFIAAMILACYTLWFALALLIPSEQRTKNNRLWMCTVCLIIVTFVQLAYGAFMAGTRAATAAPTWPKMSGFWISQYLCTNGWVRDTNVGALQLNIQFIHRTLAYVLLIGMGAWFLIVSRMLKKSSNKFLKQSRYYPLTLTMLQVILGIVAVLTSIHRSPTRFRVFESLAELHQLVAMFLLMSLVVNLYLIRRVT